MRDLTTLSFHKTTEQIVDILCQKTQNANPMFFRILTSYYLTKLASMMRVKIATPDRGNIPVNLYAINLANSGLGKNFSANILEEQFINQFQETFFSETYPVVVEENLAKLALKRSYIHNVDQDIMLASVENEFRALGKFVFSFDSGTTAAIKQMRHQLLMADIGSMNLEIDEIASNLLGNADVLSAFLELFDVGKIKQKLTKNTKENIRNEEIEGKTPTNLLLFGTPSKLLDGSKIESVFYSFLDIGYARRCLFGYTQTAIKDTSYTPEQIYQVLTDKSVTKFIQNMSSKFGKLANIVNYKKILSMAKEVSILLIEYRLHCEHLARQLGDYAEIAKAELSHRYFKALKLAGTYAFVDGASAVTKEHLYSAICMVEESGKAFDQILNRDRNYVKLAKYIASIGNEITHVDLTEDLAFYKGSASQKQDLLQLAIAWGYKHHIIIKKTISNNIEFISGETLQKIDIDKLTLAYSDDISYNYVNVTAPFSKLYKLTEQPDQHWINHHTTDGHRIDEEIKPGFDIVVLDVDTGVTIDEAKVLLKDYMFLLHTTKRHTSAKNRFRLIMPINYRLKLNAEDFKTFMHNLYEWLPFEVDTGTGQRSRKWLSHFGVYYYSQGTELIDARLFIPKTSKNKEQQQMLKTYSSLTNLERWFIHNAAGNRNNQLLKYALVLVDTGYTLSEIETKVHALNSKLKDPLDMAEVESTVLRSAAKALTNKLI